MRRSAFVQVDMLTQESAYQQIQDAKSMVEDDLQHKLEEFEEEREELVRLANTASALERELQQVNGGPQAGVARGKRRAASV